MGLRKDYEGFVGGILNAVQKSRMAPLEAKRNTILHMHACGVIGGKLTLRAKFASSIGKKKVLNKENGEKFYRCKN